MAKACKERNERFTQQHGLEIMMQSRIAEAALASTAINRKSLAGFILILYFCHLLESRGTGAHLMKIGSKRRRTKQQIEDDKLEALTKQQAIEEKLLLIARLQQENAELKAKSPPVEEAQVILTQMLDQGFVHRDEDGKWGPGPGADPSQLD